jgi:quercetin dioxygenase-like cupin family protein
MSEPVSTAPLGDVATRLLYEDERVKIWELELEPGEETPPHEHRLDHVIVVIEGDRIAGAPHALSTGASSHYIEADVTPGVWHVQKRGGIEIARNIGAKRFREILIELKDN